MCSYLSHSNSIVQILSIFFHVYVTFEEKNVIRISRVTDGVMVFVQ
jgi:hypothetical protein